MDIIQSLNDWLFSQTNSPAVSGWAFLLTIFGFALTFWQLWKTRSAAAAAEKAANEARGRALTFDAAFEVARLSSSLRESIRHINNSTWHYSVESLSEAQVALVRLGDLHERFDAIERQGLVEMIDKLSELQNRITRSQSKGTQSVSKPKAIDLLSSYQLAATRLSTRFEKVVK